MAKALRQPGIFGQLCWDAYSGVLLGFPEQPGVSQDEVMAALEKSTLRLFEAYPCLAGKVVNYGKTDTNSGRYEIVPCIPHGGKPPVRRKDCAELCTPYDQILRADAPFAMLDGNVLCPECDRDAEQPVFIIQVNFVKGGLLLYFAFHHNALDMNGHGTVIKTFATAGRGEPFDPKLVEIGNQDADTIVPFLRPGEHGLEHDNFRQPSTLHGGQGYTFERTFSNVWRFPAEKLVELKRMASGGRTWVSTNDAVTALLMQRVTAVRLASGRLKEDDAVHLRRAVNGRNKLQPPVHEGYLGTFVVEAVTEWSKATAIVQGSLAEAAVSVRESLKNIDDHSVRSLATLIRDTEDKSTIFCGGKMDPKTDILVTSWAQLDWFSGCDFGNKVGIPDFLTKPLLSQEWPSLAYVLPKTKEGHMKLAANLFHEDVVGLLNDPIWGNFTEFIG